MTEKQKFMVFRAIFLFELHIQQRWYLTGGNSFWSFIRRKKTEHFKILLYCYIVIFHNGCSKMQKYTVAGSIKGFLIMCLLKTKKISLPKLSFLQDHIEENTRMGVLGSYFCLQVILNIARQWVFRKLNFEDLRTYERHQSHLMML